MEEYFTRAKTSGAILWAEAAQDIEVLDSPEDLKPIGEAFPDGVAVRFAAATAQLGSAVPSRRRAAP